jgi:hypothetical protein
MKWCLVFAGLKDLSRPADKLSVSQNVGASVPLRVRLRARAHGSWVVGYSTRGYGLHLGALLTSDHSRQLLACCCTSVAPIPRLAQLTRSCSPCALAGQLLRWLVGYGAARADCSVSRQPCSYAACETNASAAAIASPSSRRSRRPSRHDRYITASAALPYARRYLSAR